jgi:hypothetical protein
MNSDLESRVSELESYNEITELRSTYCWYAARGDVSPIMELFTDDLQFVGPADVQGRRRTVNGRQELLSYFQAGIGKPGLVVPLVVNHVIEINGDEAHGTCAMDSPVTPGPDGRPGGAASVFYYQDRFKRVNGRWLFSYRKLSLYQPVLQLDDDRGVTGRAP